MPQLLQSWKMRSRCATVCGVTLSLEGSSGWSFGQGWPRMVQPKGELLLRPMWWLFPFQKPDTHSHLVLMPCFVFADSFTLPNSSDSRPAGIVVPITMSCRQKNPESRAQWLSSICNYSPYRLRCHLGRSNLKCKNKNAMCQLGSLFLERKH
jgi:hypothetical protein